MTDLALNGSDLALPLATVSGAEAVRQALQIRFNFFRGEWFLDGSVGIPYYQQIFGVKLRYGLSEIDAIFKDAILTTPGVIALLSYSSTLSADRTLSVTFSVQAADAVLTMLAALPDTGAGIVYVISGIR